MPLLLWVTIGFQVYKGLELGLKGRILKPCRRRLFEAFEPSFPSQSPQDLSGLRFQEAPSEARYDRPTASAQEL